MLLNNAVQMRCKCGANENITLVANSAGNYTLTASKTGYFLQSHNVTVTTGTTQNFTLTPIQLYLNIKTLKDNYVMGEVVNLTDPAELENKEISGVEGFLEFIIKVFRRIF